MPLMQNPHGPKIVVFCGPPCSGKSYLHHIFRRAHPEYWCKEMDAVRMDYMPGQIHDKVARDTAYRLLHMLAAREIASDRSVLLNATYFPPRHRAELTSLALTCHVPIYVVQFVCSGSVAAARFLAHREAGHAGTDLTQKMVRELAERYERFDGALLINTDKVTDTTEQLALVEAYLHAGTPTDPVRWAIHDYRGMPPSKSSTLDSVTKLSQASVKLAKRRRRYYRLGFFSIAAASIAGIGSIFSKLFMVSFGSWRNPVDLVLWPYGNSHIPDWVTFSTFCVAAAGVASLITTYGHDIQEKFDKSNAVANAGKIPSFNSAVNEIDVTPSDVEIYHSYYERLPSDQQQRMPICNVPIFFCLSSKKMHSYKAIVELEKNDQGATSVLPSEAATFGMDWPGFLDWRFAERTRHYYRSDVLEVGLKCTHIGFADAAHTKLSVRGAKSSYIDYLGTELSSNLCSPGVLPDFRRLLEGPAWYGGQLNLEDVAEASRRYSMRMSVSALIITQDGYFILQRRSAAVAAGIGNLSPSTAGAADYSADRSNTGLLGRPEWDLRKTAIREIGEEIGLRKNELKGALNPKVVVPPFDRPFLAAAYNLRHGRDLNFYCCFGTPLKSYEISGCRNRRSAKDRWEVARLEFLDVNRVTTAAIASGDLSDALPGGSRHLRGALYAWAVYAGL